MAPCSFHIQALNLRDQQSILPATTNLQLQLPANLKQAISLLQYAFFALKRNLLQTARRHVMPSRVEILLHHRIVEFSRILEAIYGSNHSRCRMRTLKGVAHLPFEIFRWTRWHNASTSSRHIVLRYGRQPPDIAHRSSEYSVGWRFTNRSQRDHLWREADGARKERRRNSPNCNRLHLEETCGKMRQQTYNLKKGSSIAANSTWSRYSRRSRSSNTCYQALCSATQRLPCSGQAGF